MYYLKGLFTTPPLPSGLVHLHGLVMTAWVVLFVVQVRLISTKRIRLHQKLGYASIGLAASSSRPGCRRPCARPRTGSTSTPPGAPPLSFLLIPTFDLVMFALFFGAAIIYRRRPAAHKALMLLTASLPLLALARIPIASLQATGPVWFFGFPTVVVLLCLILDARRHGRVNRVLAVGATAHGGRLHRQAGADDDAGMDEHRGMARHVRLIPKSVPGGSQQLINDNNAGGGMMDRRTFIQGAVASAALVLPMSQPLRRYKMGLQLYTMRAAMARDVAGTLGRISALGYQEVETYGFAPDSLGYYGLSAKAFSAAPQGQQAHDVERALRSE